MSMTPFKLGYLTSLQPWWVIGALLVLACAVLALSCHRAGHFPTWLDRAR